MRDDLLRLMLVDDEHLARDLLKRCIDWAEVGYEVAAEASCAQEALELIEKEIPDVIFTDICMPYIDGIEFAKIVFERYPTVKIVILTGHEEFEFAKRSIKIGVADFLLKPINDDEIRKVALGVREKIESERSHRAEYDRLKKSLEENLPHLRERLLNELLQSNVEAGALKQRLDYFQINLSPSFVQIALVEAVPPDTGNQTGEEDRLLLRIRCLETVGLYFREDASVYTFFDSRQRIVVLNGDKELDLVECLEAVKSMLINRLKCHVSMGVGGCHTGWSRAKTSYREACNALDYKVIAGKNQVISYCDINSSSNGRFEVQIEQLDSLAFFLKAGMRSRALDLLDGVFNENSLGPGCGIDSIRAAASNIVAAVLNVVAEMGISLQEVFEHSQQPFEGVFRLDTFPELRDYLKELIASCGGLIENLQSKKVNQAVKQVREYIMEHLSDDLSLSKTARAFYFNVSYLSRIFKQETGQTFVEYLTRARMEKAIRLLKETDLKAYQIAESVGIADPHYFGICFKKYTGMSINDFRRIE